MKTTILWRFILFRLHIQNSPFMKVQTAELFWNVNVKQDAVLCQLKKPIFYELQNIENISNV